MKEIKLSNYAKNCITNDNVAKRVYDDIIAMQPLDNEIVINMDEMITIAIPCINIIFGGLYDYMGADKFSENIILQGCSNTLGDFISFILKERLKNRDENASD